MNKWKNNKKYCNDNYKIFQKIYGGNNIVIVDEKVAFAYEPGTNNWYQLWDLLNSEEKLEAYSTYIPRENEIIVI